MRLARRFMMLGLAAMLCFAVLYGSLYVRFTNVESVPAGTAIFASCSYGAPLDVESRKLSRSGTCRVFRTSVDMIVFRVAFQVESMFKDNLFMRIEKPD